MKINKITLSLLFFFLVGCNPKTVLTSTHTQPLLSTISTATLTPTHPVSSPTFTAAQIHIPSPTQTLIPIETPTDLVSDTVILQAIFENHEPPYDSPDWEETTFDDFSRYLIYTREDIDVNEDGRSEILISGSWSLSKWAFFIIYFDAGLQQLQELYYLDTTGGYLADVQFDITSPYIFVDFLTTSGGYALFSSEVTRNIVRCAETGCDSIAYVYLDGDTWGGYKNSSLHISGNQLEINENGFRVEKEIACDPSGREIFDALYDNYYVATSYYYKYSWENNHFSNVDYQETPGFEVLEYSDRDFTGKIVSMIRESVGPDATPQQIRDAYFDFFNADSNVNYYLPCDDVNENSDLLSQAIPATAHSMGDYVYYAAVSEWCRLVVWKENPETRETTIEDLEIIGRRSLPYCNPIFISFQWMDITASNTPELVITSGVTGQTIWIFDVSTSLELIHQAIGYSLENPMANVQLQKMDNEIVLKVEFLQCLDRFDCLFSENEFETFIWNHETQSFIPSP